MRKLGGYNRGNGVTENATRNHIKPLLTAVGNPDPKSATRSVYSQLEPINTGSANFQNLGNLPETAGGGYDCGYTRWAMAARELKQ